MTDVTTTQNAAPAVAALPDPWETETVAIEDFGLPGSIMIHAEPGQGKTRTGAGIIKVPGFKKLAIIDIDNGSEAILNDPELVQAYRDGRIKIIKIDKTKPDAFARFHTIFWDLVTNPRDFDCVMIDTLDVAQECAVNYYKATTYNDTATALDTRKAYGVIAEWTTNVLWALQNHPQLTGITLVHTMNHEEKKTGTSALKPKFQGSAKDNAAGIPSLVAYLKKERHDDGRVNVTADIGGADGAIAKQRYSSFLPDHINDFSLPLIYRLIRGEEVMTTTVQPADPTAELPTEIPAIPTLAATAAA
ncbi:MAG: hypothetical protein K0S37_765 [Microbacterium sp.]|nr:hypothetical protein [Microbacterium sp.]